MNYLKKMLLAFTTLLAIACTKTPEHASIEGEIKNLPEAIKELTLRTENNVKTVAITNGSFKDTINIDGEMAFIQIGKFGQLLFLNKNTHLKINLDATDYRKTLTYSGDGASNNNYIVNRENITQKVFENIDSINGLNKTAFSSYLHTMENNIANLIAKSKDVDPKLIKTEQDGLKDFIENLKHQYESINSAIYSLKKGTPSPEFENYDNYKGGTTSLKDLKGSYVYIDVWATWCNPCLAEIPSLKRLEKKLHGKNIKFVSISIDNLNAKEKWQNMVKSKNLKGIQLFAKGDQRFLNQYRINGIPRFILLDPEGNIVEANAPRPSNPNIENLLNSLL